MTLGAFAMLGGIVVIAGWVLDVPVLSDWGITGGLSTQPNSAVAVFSAGLAILLLSTGYRYLAALSGLVPLALGGATLFEHFGNVDLGIDTALLFDRAWGGVATTAPGRMGIPGATGFSLLGIGFVLCAFQRTRRISPILGVAVIGVSAFSLIGYLFGASALFNIPKLTAIAFPTTLMLTALGLALVMALPAHEPMRTLFEDSAAGLLARQSLPFIIVLPIVLAFLRLRGETAGLYGTGFGTSILVVLLIILLLAVLWHGVNAVRVKEVAQQRVEDALREREVQLKDADRRKDEFLATLAHELRNPLAPISNSLAIMKRADTDADLRSSTRDIMERQVGHMVRLIDDLLDISRITAGKLELRPGTVDVGSIIHQAVESSRPLIERARHDIHVDLPREPLSTRGDPVRLAQVFGNLLSNAAKFTPPGGRLRIAAQRDGADVVVTVEDNGLGIPAEQLDSIFELFTQVDRSMERSQGGLGIGLTLAKRLVELHGGRIAAASDGPGKGSRFVVRLPATAARVEEPVKPVQEDATAQGHRILIVDDNRDNADSLAMLLQMSGNETHTAHDGEEAVASALRLKPDAVLLDIGLPKLNGYDACRRIRSQLNGHKLAIYAITGWGQEADRKRSAEAGFDGHLVKPVDAETLMRLLASL